MPEFNIPILGQIQGALVEVKPLIDVRDSHFSRLGEEDQRDHDAPRCRHRYAKPIRARDASAFFHSLVARAFCFWRCSPCRSRPRALRSMTRILSRLQCGRALRQRRLPGARRLLGRRSRGRGEKGGPAATVQRKRLLVLAGNRSGAGQSFGPHLRRRRQTCASSPTAGRKGHFAAAHLMPKTTGQLFHYRGDGEVAGGANPLGAGLRVSVGARSRRFVLRARGVDHRGRRSTSKSTQEARRASSY